MGSGKIFSVWSMRVGEYCFPSTHYKNKALAGQDMLYVSLISTSQEGTKKGRKGELMGGEGA